MNRKLIVIFGLVFATLLLSGCFDSDRNGMKACKASYDNFKLKEGYRVLDHSSDFLCCVENRFMVSYMIGHNNSIWWLHGFVYDSEDDKLIWSGNKGKDLPDYVLGIN